MNSLTQDALQNLINQFAVNNTNLAVKTGSNKAVVAQFVSNCDSKSDRSYFNHAWQYDTQYQELLRENLVKSLSKYIPVDVFGACGTLKCDRNWARKIIFKVLTFSSSFWYRLINWLFEVHLLADYMTTTSGVRMSLATRCSTPATSSTWPWRTACARTTSRRSSSKSSNLMWSQVFPSDW